MKNSLHQNFNKPVNSHDLTENHLSALPLKSKKMVSGQHSKLLKLWSENCYPHVTKYQTMRWTKWFPDFFSRLFFLVSNFVNSPIFQQNHCEYHVLQCLCNFVQALANFFGTCLIQFHHMCLEYVTLSLK